MKKWKKTAALCLVFCLLLTAVVWASDTSGSSAQGAEQGAAQSAEAPSGTADTAETAAAAKEDEAAVSSAEAAENTAPADTTEAAETGSSAETSEAAETASSAETGKDGETADTIDAWAADSPAMASIIEAVASFSDPASDSYRAPEERIAVFDMDGTLYGELFPTYFDQCMLMYRFLHDETFDTDTMPAEDREFLQRLETALLNGEEEPDSPRSTAQMTAESFRGYSVEEYRAYVRKFMDQPVAGFEGMTYGEGFYQPMVGLVRYLADHDFRVYIVSGGERSMIRELCRDTLGEWIPPYQIIGSTFSLTATGQGDTAARDYTYTADDRVLLEGNMISKNLKMNKIVNIVNEIGVIPVLAFGNSSGDFAMAQYTVQNGGRAYMLLCDDTDRDYGSTEKAASFAEKCSKLGFETVSMKNEFATIYGENVKKTGFRPAEAPATSAPSDTAAPAEEEQDQEELAPAA